MQQMNLQGNIVIFEGFKQLNKAEALNIWFALKKPGKIKYVEVVNKFNKQLLFSSEYSARSFSKKVNGFTERLSGAKFKVYFC